MKIRHKVPAYDPPSAVVGEAYENEVQRSTAKLERQYAQAQKRFDRAERELNRARKRPGSRNRKRQLSDLEAVVELRRIELQKYERMMTVVAASAQHRGDKSYRPIAQGGVL